MEVKIIYSYMYNRQLNYHKSKEHVHKRFQELEGSCAELKELTDRFLLKSIYKMEDYVGEKIPREEIRIYIVDRERGGSFHEPLTIQFDEDQKFMFAELLHLVGHHLIREAGPIGEAKINLVVSTVLKDLPLNFEKQMQRLHKNQEHRYPVAYFTLDEEKYNLKKKKLHVLFPKKEEEQE